MAKLKKRADGRYQCAFTYDGRKYTVYARSAKELTEKKLKKIQQLKTNSLNHANPTLDMYYGTFTELRRNKVKESTIRCQKSSYRNCADVVIDGIKLGEMRIRSITPKDCQRVQQALMKKDYTSRTVNDCMKHLSHVFNAAVKDETIDRNPCMCIEHLRRTETPARETKHRALTKQETETFFRSAAGSFYLPYFKMMIQTGLRIGELCALTTSDIDLKENCIHVTKTITRDEVGGYMVGNSAKTYAGTRDIPLNTAIRDAVADQKKQKRLLPFSPLLFCSAEGKIMREYTVNREIRRICKKAGMDPFTCHAFRATFATRFIEQRPQDYKILSEILGHANIKITLDLYTHVMKDSKEAAMTGIEIAM